MKYFKQILLAVFVVGAYILYSLHARGDGEPAAGLPTPAALSNDTATPDASGSAASVASAGAYKDGSYTGTAANAFYGDIQVRATVSGGKLTDVKFLQYPGDRHESLIISNRSLPVLRQEAISAQSAKVDIVTGATDTSEAFIQSLGSALAAAK